LVYTFDLTIDPREVATRSIVYPFGTHEHRFLDDNDTPAAAIDDESELKSCRIPFYHIGDGLYPGGQLFRLNSTAWTSYEKEAQINLRDSGLFVTSAVIVTLKSLGQLIKDCVPHHMTAVISLICNYLPSIENWNVVPDVRNQPHTISISYQLCYASIVLY
jgi:hypothetical protein